MAAMFDRFMRFVGRWIFTPIVYIIFRGILRWRVGGDLPDEPKMLAAFAPHTSNIDFFFMIYLMAHFNVSANWIGKEELFEGRFGALSYWTGGIPVDRDAPLKAMKQLIKYIKTHDKAIICIAPEGTRHYIDHWKKGFYYIAHKTQIPIVFFKLNYPTRTITAWDAFYTTGNIEEDIQAIAKFYEDAIGYNPESAAPVRFLADEN